MKPPINSQSNITYQNDSHCSDESTITRDVFNETLYLYESTSASLQPCLPKLQENHNTYYSISEMNQSKLSEISSLDNIHLNIYCDAYAVINLNKQTNLRTISSSI